jgi:Holliday junction resolvase-like predicted endonuclease
MDVMIIARQLVTPCGRIDLLAIDGEANLVVLELKRDKTPRDVVAQTLDYGSWIKELTFDAVDRIARDYLKKPLKEAFAARFEEDLPEAVNQSHQLVILASSLDDSSERIAAGHGLKYSRPLRKLREGDLIFAYMKDRGYVGYGKVRQPAVMVHEFVVDPSGKKLLELPLVQPNIGDLASDPEKSEWAVGIEWLKSFSRDDARWFKGGFANQNIVCKLRDPDTVAFLKKEFSLE